MGVREDLFYVLKEKSEGVEDRGEETVIGGNF